MLNNAPFHAKGERDGEGVCKLGNNRRKYVRGCKLLKNHYVKDDVLDYSNGIMTGIWGKVKRLPVNEEVSSDRAFQVCQGKGERISPSQTEHTVGEHCNQTALGSRTLKQTNKKRQETKSISTKKHNKNKKEQIRTKKPNCGHHCRVWPENKRQFEVSKQQCAHTRSG